VRFTNPRNCEVRTGEWFDEYTGETFTVAAQIDLDHVIPLRYAHNQGGDAWPAEKKIAFANDPANLVLTERGELRKKGDRGPSRYLPREEYRCDYARQWLAIAEKYDLRLASQDNNRITLLLRDCGVD
jgi:endonuclease I